ncbi:hypothetical protein CMO92_01960 [Candidatus Woesearchaeota archaeon]|nr:hypothetical protein [Candidatus Woesearchaeota archaeon]
MRGDSRDFYGKNIREGNPITFDNVIDIGLDIRNGGKKLGGLAWELVEEGARLCGVSPEKIGLNSTLLRGIEESKPKKSEEASKGSSLEENILVSTKNKGLIEVGLDPVCISEYNHNQPSSRHTPRLFTFDEALSYLYDKGQFMMAPVHHLAFIRTLQRGVYAREPVFSPSGEQVDPNRLEKALIGINTDDSMEWVHARYAMREKGLFVEWPQVGEIGLRKCVEKMKNTLENKRSLLIKELIEHHTDVGLPKKWHMYRDGGDKSGSMLYVPPTGGSVTGIGIRAEDFYLDCGIARNMSLPVRPAVVYRGSV